MHPSRTNPADSLHEEQQATHRLIEILKQEQSYLIKADIEGLTALTEEKTKLVTRMSQLANARYTALSAAGFPPKEEGMRDWLKGTTSAANQAWNELLALAKTAKELNRTNGLLINKHMARNQTALNILYGNAPGGSFYGPDGQSTARSGTRNLVIG